MNWMTEIDLLVTENKFSKPEKSKLPWWKRIETIYNCEPEQTKRGERKEKKVNYALQTLKIRRIRV